MKLSRREAKLLKEKIITNHSPDSNVISLPGSAFCENGRLAANAYEEMKKEIQYVNVKEQITVELPEKRMITFLPCLKAYIAKELVSIKNEIKKQVKITIALYLVAFLVYGIYEFILDTNVFHEMIIVTFWVLNFNAVEKIIFDIPSLKRRERKLLQLASVNVKKFKINFNQPKA